jgi:hypothetical protein
MIDAYFIWSMTHLRSVSHSIKLDPNGLWSSISWKRRLQSKLDARKFSRLDQRRTCEIRDPLSPPAAFGMASAHSPAQVDSLAGYKAVVPPLFHQLSPSFLLPLHFGDISCLRPLASSTFPRPSPAGPRLHRKIGRSQSEECLHATAGCYSLEVSAALSRQLPGCGSPLGNDEG